MNVLKVTKSGGLSHVGRRTASLRTSCAVPGSVGGAEKADCVALRRPAACGGIEKQAREEPSGRRFLEWVVRHSG